MVCTWHWGGLSHIPPYYYLSHTFIGYCPQTHIITLFLIKFLLDTPSLFVTHTVQWLSLSQAISLTHTVIVSHPYTTIFSHSLPFFLTHCCFVSHTVHYHNASHRTAVYSFTSTANLLLYYPFQHTLWFLSYAVSLKRYSISLFQSYHLRIMFICY